MTDKRVKKIIVLLVLGVCLTLAAFDLRANTISSPVSVTIGEGFYGNLDSRPVSVTIGEGFYGNLDSRPVSVTVGEGFYGNLDSYPVSVSKEITPPTIPGIVALYHMDDDEWIDYSGNGFHLTPSGGATFTTDSKLGYYAGSFDGTDDAAIAWQGSELATTAPNTFTVEFWAKPEATRNTTTQSSSGISGLGGQRYATGPSHGWDTASGMGVSVGTNGVSVFEHGSNYLPSVLVYDTPISGWVHVAVVYTDKEPSLYLNGEYIKKGVKGNRNVNVYPSFRLGAYSTYGAFKGVLDEVVIYNRALTASEIRAHYDDSFVDRTPPVVPTVTPETATTTTQTITLSGTKEADSSIWINNIQVVALTSSTSWSYAYTLGAGVNLLKITSRDAVGNESAAVYSTILYDGAAPYVTASVPAAASSMNVAVNTVKFYLADVYSLINFTATTGGATVKNASGQALAGSWSSNSGEGSVTFTPSTPITDGTYVVTIYPADMLGNAGTATLTFTVDTVAPPAPAINAVTTPTKNTSQTITGTKSADTTVIQMSSDTTLSFGTVTYPSPTTWSVLASGLKEGLNTISAAARDAAGNSSGQVSAAITVDTVAPDAPTVNGVTTPTTSSTVMFTGSKDPASYVYVNNNKLAAAYSDTAWSYTPSLSEGSNNFTFYAKDEAGNQSASVSKSVVKDTSTPVIGLSSPVNASSVTQVNSIEITLSDAGSSVDLEASLAAGAVVKDSTGSVINGIWQIDGAKLIFTPASLFVASTYSVTLYPVDALGNSGTLILGFTLDNTAPALLSMTMSPSSPHKAENVTFTFSFNEDMDAGATVMPVVEIDKGLLYAAKTLTGGSWQNSKTWKVIYPFTSGTGDGTYDVTVYNAKDKAGNQMASTVIGSFVLDTTPPSSPGINSVNALTNIATQNISGTKEANTAIIINNTQRVALNAETAWSYLYPLVEGVNTINVIARDEAGNDSVSATASIKLDTTPPEFNITNYVTPSSTATQTISGTKEAGITVRLNGNVIIEPSDMLTTWSYTVSLTEGLATRFTFEAIDAMGNKRTKTLDMLYDTSAPAPIIGLNADGNGNGSEVNLAWQAYVETQDIAYYRVYRATSDFADVAGLTPVGTINKGTKTFKVSGLTEGILYYFAVVPVDASGNFDSKVYSASATPSDTVAPEDVTNLKVLSEYNATDGNYASLAWTASANTKGDLVGQTIYFDSGAGFDNGTPLGASVTSYKKTGLSDAALYRFKITTKDSAGHESSGTTVSVVTRLPNPANLTADPGKNKATLTWSAPVTPFGYYIKQYNIYRKQSANKQTDVSSMTLVKVVTSGTSYVDTGITNGVTYQYAITTVNTFFAENRAVESVGVMPRQDEIGPVISGFNLTNNQVVTAPVTVSAMATDAESTLDKMEIYIDGVHASTQSGSALSVLWNVVAIIDGNHVVTVKAYDSVGNMSEVSASVVVSLAPPIAPIITKHTVEAVTPDYLVKVEGSAPLYTEVKLSVNGTIVGGSVVDVSGKFAVSGVKLTEGENILAAKAIHRGGESAFSTIYRVTVDTGAPTAPTALTAKVLAGGTVQFAWIDGVGEVPIGYNMYESLVPFVSKSDAGVTKNNSMVLKYAQRDYIPANDTLRYYAVTALDGAGNESSVSNVVSISSDRAVPQVQNVTYEITNGSVDAAGPGLVTVNLVVSEPLLETPFFSLEPSNGSPIVLSIAKTDDTHYKGSFTVTSSTPHGATVYKFSGKDMTGNRGNAQGPGLAIDSKGPVASVAAPTTLLQITNEPVPVSIVLDEVSVSTPIVELKDAAAKVASVVGLTSSDGLTWNGTIDISLFTAGTATFILKGAKDALGNVGTVINGGKTIALYKDVPLPPPVPSWITATQQKGGKISLSWENIEGEQSYNVYRRAEGESTPTIAGNFAVSTGIDLPAADGKYYYSVASVGYLSSESTRSDEASAVSDRTPPAVPQNLILTLTGGGVSAAWQNGNSSETPKYYRFYRASGEITDIAVATLVATLGSASAVDPAPVKTQNSYAVTSMDTLGNESAPSATAQITFPVAPVRDLVLTVIDTGKPALTWVAPESGLLGYNIYRNGMKINSTPSVATSFTDSYYAGGTVKYGISAVSTIGESPVKEVTIPDMAIGIKDGTVLRRGLLETVGIVITNKGQGAFTLSSVGLKVGGGESSVVAGPFTVIEASGITVDKVAATAGDAASPVPLVVTAALTPSPGATVNIIRTLSVSVTGASTALEVYNEPLVRSADAKVSFKVNNLGTAQMEFLTSENNGATNQVRVNLRDVDGNLLATGKLDQRTGNVVNVGSYAVARLNPGESVLTLPVVFTVPSGAPQRVVIEAIIEKTYYHYGKPEQVTAPGMKVTFETLISDAPYNATAKSDKAVYKVGEAVNISGTAYMTGTTTPAANVPVKIGMSVKGFDRFYSVATDANGKFSYVFTPGIGDIGKFSLWASHPDVKDKMAQAQFDVIGLNLSPSGFNLKMTKNRSYDMAVTLTNPSAVELTGLSMSLSAPEGITAEAINLGTSLGAGQSRSVTLRVTAASTAPDTASVVAAFGCAEGVSREFPVNIALFTAIPLIKTSPSYIDTGLVRGTQKVASFDIANVGYETLRNARIEGPSTPWMTLTVDRNIGDIAAGSAKSIGIMLKPGENVAQGVYDDKVVIYSDNHIPYTYNIQVSVTSSAIGNVLFDVLNELMEDVANATITVQNQDVYELIYTIKTAADGTVLLTDIPEGRYAYNISATNHRPRSGTFTVSPGVTTYVPIGMEITLVDVQWSVTETTIQDVYTINVQQTFVTNVPAPVLVVEPASVTLPELKPGETFSGEYKVTNYGLIGMFNMRTEFSASRGEYDMVVMTEAMPERLEAMQSVTIPYRITRRAQVAWNYDGGYSVIASGAKQSSGSGNMLSDAMADSAPVCTDQPLVANAGDSYVQYSSLFAETAGYGATCYDALISNTFGDCPRCTNTPQEFTAIEKGTFIVFAVLPCPIGLVLDGNIGSVHFLGDQKSGDYRGISTQAQLQVFDCKTCNGFEGDVPKEPCLVCKKDWLGNIKPVAKDDGTPIKNEPCSACVDGKKVSKSIEKVTAALTGGTENGTLYTGAPAEFKADASTSSCTTIDWKWNFGDGESKTVTGSKTSTVTHEFKAAGEYNVTVTAICSGCAQATSEPITVVVTCENCPQNDHELAGNQCYVCTNGVMSYTEDVPLDPKGCKVCKDHKVKDTGVCGPDVLECKEAERPPIGCTMCVAGKWVQLKAGSNSDLTCGMACTDDTQITDKCLVCAGGTIKALEFCSTAADGSCVADSQCKTTVPCFYGQCIANRCSYSNYQTEECTLSSDADGKPVVNYTDINGNPASAPVDVTNQAPNGPIIVGTGTGYSNPLAPAPTNKCTETPKMTVSSAKIDDQVFEGEDKILVVSTNYIHKLVGEASASDCNDSLYKWDALGRHAYGMQSEVLFDYPGVYPVEFVARCRDCATNNYVSVASKKAKVMALRDYIYGIVQMGYAAPFTVSTVTNDAGEKILRAIPGVRMKLVVPNQGENIKIINYEWSTTGGKFYKDNSVDSAVAGTDGATVSGGNLKEVYWEGDASVWPLDATVKVKLTVEVTVYTVDASGKSIPKSISVPHTITRKIQGRDLKPMTPNMKGDDVRMLQQALNLLGLAQTAFLECGQKGSAYYGKCGLEGTPVEVNGIFTGGQTPVGSEDKGNTEVAVRLLQTMDVYFSSKLLVTGVFNQYTAKQLRLHWVDYLKAVAEYPSAPSITISHPHFENIAEPANAWTFFAGEELKATYTDDIVKSIYAGGATFTAAQCNTKRKELLSSWIRQEVPGHWGQSDGQTTWPYRMTMGSYDRAGSVGFSQVVSEHRYGTNSAFKANETFMDLNLYHPKDGVKAFAVWANMVVGSASSGSFAKAFGKGTTAAIYKKKIYFAATDELSIGPASHESGNTSYEDDNKDLLAKALSGYNHGSTDSQYSSLTWPEILKSNDVPILDPQDNTKILNGGLRHSIGYALSIKRRMNIPLKEWTFWKRVEKPVTVGVWPLSYTYTAVKYCKFTYTEEEWLIGKKVNNKTVYGGTFASTFGAITYDSGCVE